MILDYPRASGRPAMVVWHIIYRMKYIVQDAALVAWPLGADGGPARRQAPLLAARMPDICFIDEVMT